MLLPYKKHDVRVTDGCLSMIQRKWKCGPVEKTRNEGKKNWVSVAKSV